MPAVVYLATAIRVPRIVVVPAGYTPDEWSSCFAAYGLRLERVAASVLSGGQDNLNLRLQSDGHEYALRRYLRTRPEEVDYEIALIDHLVGRGFRTPRVVRSLDGRGAIRIGGTACALFA